jgi:hypothetical protein
MIRNAPTLPLRRTLLIAAGTVSLAVAAWLLVFGGSGFRGADTADSNGALLVSEQQGEPSRRASGGPSSQRNEPRVLARVPRLTDAPFRETELLAMDVRRVAVTSVSGKERAVFVGRESQSMTCLILQDRASGGGGCNHAADAFAGSSVWWSSVHSNYPRPELTIFGVVSADVKAIRLVFKNGNEMALALSSDGGFIHVVAKDKILPEDVPDRVVSLDREGNVIDSIPLGITFGE